VSVDDARALHEAAPSSQLVIVDGMNHVLKIAPADPQKNYATYSPPCNPKLRKQRTLQGGRYHVLPAKGGKSFHAKEKALPPVIGILFANRSRCHQVPCERSKGKLREAAYEQPIGSINHGLNMIRLVSRSNSPWNRRLVVLTIALATIAFLLGGCPTPWRGYETPTRQSWQIVGTAGFSATVVSYTSLAIDSTDTPYVAYQEGFAGKATVMKYAGGSWQTVGTTGFSAGGAHYTSLAIDSTDTPYVAYQDGANSNKATVMKHAGGSWQAVGTAGFSAGEADYTFLAIDSTDTPYVAYADWGNGGKATVMKYAGGSWQTVGTAGFSAGRAFDVSLAIDSTGTPYVAYKWGNATVMKYAGGSWQTVGTADFSLGTAFHTSLAIDSTDTPYVAYADWGSWGSYPTMPWLDCIGGKATVMVYVGGSWAAVDVGFSAGEAEYASLAIDSTDTPYVAYQDYGNGGSATVMKYPGGIYQRMARRR
jgi:hypothetical protein